MSLITFDDKKEILTNQAMMTLPGPHTKTVQLTASKGRLACERDEVAQIAVEAVKISGQLCLKSMAKLK